MNNAVRPSVCLSVTSFSLCSHHRIIMKIPGVITNDRSDESRRGQKLIWPFPDHNYSLNSYVKMK